MKLIVGWIKLIWYQDVQVKSQQNSIHQMRDHECLVSDVSKRHGGKQMIQTPNGVILSIVIKNGSPYIKHYCPTKKKMFEILREKIVTSKNDWDLSKYDDLKELVNYVSNNFHPLLMQLQTVFMI